MAHSVMHFEVVGKDLDKLQKFYGDLFGWNTKKIPGDMPYAMVDKEDGGIGGGYLNYATESAADDLETEYGAQRYERLRAVKRQYDAANVFRFNHNISPD